MDVTEVVNGLTKALDALVRLAPWLLKTPVFVAFLLLIMFLLVVAILKIVPVLTESHGYLIVLLGFVGVFAVILGGLFLRPSDSPHPRPSAREEGCEGGPSGEPSARCVGIMQFAGHGSDRYFGCYIRSNLNSVLSERDLKVFAGYQMYKITKEVEQGTKRTNGDEFYQRLSEKAREIGIGTLISGGLQRQFPEIRLRVEIADTATATIRAQTFSNKENRLARFQGNAEDFILDALFIHPDRHVDVGENNLSDDTIKDYLDSMQIACEDWDVEGAEKTGQGGPGDAPTGRQEIGARIGRLVAIAEAQGNAEAQVQAVLDRYRDALQSKNSSAFESLYVQLNGGQREALERYFNKADNLNVNITDRKIKVEGDKAVATFSRKDDFTEVSTGRPVVLQVRVNMNLVKNAEDEWHIESIVQ